VFRHLRLHNFSPHARGASPGSAPRNDPAQTDGKNSESGHTSRSANVTGAGYGRLQIGALLRTGCRGWLVSKARIGPTKDTTGPQHLCHHPTHNHCKKRSYQRLYSKRYSPFFPQIQPTDPTPTAAGAGAPNLEASSKLPRAQRATAHALQSTRSWGGLAHDELSRCPPAVPLIGRPYWKPVNVPVN
jgi:hypothetical protein